MSAVAVSLTDLLARARDHRMTPAERRSQRISMIMGLKGKSSTLTREKVESVLDEIEGHNTENAPRKD